ncbi:type VI secretion system Vgr family protein [Duganella sp. 1411]|uniref:type VI secretion system Vgr family protein n=1 Tax=Duganella sp. 1411 TaxID=2806572 RepID=UPI001AEB3E9E
MAVRAGLNLGHLVRQSDNQRLKPAGFGAELKTEHGVAMRAGVTRGYNQSSISQPHHEQSSRRTQPRLSYGTRPSGGSTGSAGRLVSARRVHSTI